MTEEDILLADAEAEARRSDAAVRAGLCLLSKDVPEHVDLGVAMQDLAKCRGSTKDWAPAETAKQKVSTPLPGFVKAGVTEPDAGKKIAGLVASEQKAGYYHLVDLPAKFPAIPSNIAQLIRGVTVGELVAFSTSSRRPCRQDPRGLHSDEGLGPPGGCLASAVPTEHGWPGLSDYVGSAGGGPPTMSGCARPVVLVGGRL